MNRTLYLIDIYLIIIKLIIKINLYQLILVNRIFKSKINLEIFKYDMNKTKFKVFKKIKIYYHI